MAALLFGTYLFVVFFSPNTAMILCGNIQTICKRSDTACYSSPCALAAPDLYTIIDDDLAEDLVWKKPSVVPPQESSVSDPGINFVPKFKDDAAGDYLNALPIAETLTDEQDQGSSRRSSRSSESQMNTRRAGISPIVNEGHFVSLHSAKEGSAETHMTGRMLLAGLIAAWMLFCVVSVCVRKKLIQREQVVEKDGSVMTRVGDESDESCDEPDEYGTTPEPPLMKGMNDDV